MRFADDAAMVFSDLRDAQRVLAVLPKRFQNYSLKLHPDKTRLACFSRPLPNNKKGKGPGSFNFLGFTNYWGKSRKGNWVVKQKTAKDRLTRAIEKMARWCRKVRHRKVKEQHAMLVMKMRGHYAYYGITGNMRNLLIFSEQVR